MGWSHPRIPGPTRLRAGPRHSRRLQEPAPMRQFPWRPASASVSPLTSAQPVTLVVTFDIGSAGCLGGYGRERFRQCVHLLSEALAIGWSELAVVGEAQRSVPAVGIEAVLYRRETRLDVVRERIFSARGKRWAQQLECHSGSGQVALEVGEIGVRIAVLLARDLGVGDLVEQLHRSVGKLRRLIAECLHLLAERGDICQKLRRIASGALSGVVQPQDLLDAVKAGPLLDARHIVDARIDARIQIAKALGYRLDRLVVAAHRSEQGLGLLHIASP